MVVEVVVVVVVVGAAWPLVAFKSLDWTEGFVSGFVSVVGTLSIDTKWCDIQLWERLPNRPKLFTGLEPAINSIADNFSFFVVFLFCNETGSSVSNEMTRDCFKDPRHLVRTYITIVVDVVVAVVVVAIYFFWPLRFRGGRMGRFVSFQHMFMSKLLSNRQKAKGTQVSRRRRSVDI